MHRSVPSWSRSKISSLPSAIFGLRLVQHLWKRKAEKYPVKMQCGDQGKMRGKSRGREVGRCRWGRWLLEKGTDEETRSDWLPVRRWPVACESVVLLYSWEVTADVRTRLARARCHLAAKKTLPSAPSFAFPFDLTLFPSPPRRLPSFWTTDLLLHGLR